MPSLLILQEKGKKINKNNEEKNLVETNDLTRREKPRSGRVRGSPKCIHLPSRLS
jgi:hypothetical protein